MKPRRDRPQSSNAVKPLLERDAQTRRWRDDPALPNMRNMR
jgi:hypothetical protein